MLTQLDMAVHFSVRRSLSSFPLPGIPIFEAEPGLRLLSLQHNFIKRVQHLHTTHRLVFLDLYHNRLDLISNIDSLVNLRVLMLGKNRIRRVEGLQRCNRLSVLDLHGNRITQVRRNFKRTGAGARLRESASRVGGSRNLADT